MPKVLVFLFLWFPLSLFSQQLDRVDFRRVAAAVAPSYDTEGVTGMVEYTFKALKDVDSVYLDAVNMRITTTPTGSIPVTASSSKIWFQGPFKQGIEYTVTFGYEAFPKQTLYFFGDQIWTQGQGKYTSHWLPSLDDMNDKMEFDLTIVAPMGKTVVANGELVSTETKGQQAYWKFDMQQPMSSYLVALAMGNFKSKELTANSAIPIQLYYSEEDSLMVEPTYRYSAEIFDFLEREIGVPYPWQNYKQVPVRDFLYAGMENTTATIFSEAFVVDSIGFTDRNYVNVNAHELAHQWFGNLVTETEGTHHWLQEGFATYFALLAERAVFGDDYFYWKLYNSAEQLKAVSESGKGEAVVNAAASSLTYYEKGAWALRILREKIGAETFRKAIVSYLKKFQFRNVTTSDFISEVEKVSGHDLTQWRANWLEQAAFQSEDAYRSLLKSDFIANYFELVRLRPIPLSEKFQQLLNAVNGVNEYLGQEAVFQLREEPLENSLPLYEAALSSENIYIRQAVALSLNQIPQSLLERYEALLRDTSYVTNEAALYNLWMQFPEERSRYLDETQNVVGFHDRNVRQLWLALALLTEGYQETNKGKFKSELQGYTSPDFSFEVRKIAFEFIGELNLFSGPVLKNLVNAATHPNWRFRTFARELLAELLEDVDIKSAIYSDFDHFSEAEKAYLNRINTDR